MAKTLKFSQATIDFLKKAGRQRNPEWLDKNREEYERVLLLPLQSLARHLKSTLASKAPGYNFPQKGIGRVKRSANRVAEGGSLFKRRFHYSASVPRISRFDHNPNLLLIVSPHDPDEGILVAGGLYMPSSRQLRSLREAVAEDASAFEELFKTKEFKSCFPDGFSDERISSRPPRGFDPDHPRINWLKLQAFFVWKPYTKRQFLSPKFAEQVERDWAQVIRLNDLIDKAIQGRLPKAVRAAPDKNSKSPDIAERLGDLHVAHREMDF